MFSYMEAPDIERSPSTNKDASKTLSLEVIHKNWNSGTLTLNNDAYLGFNKKHTPVETEENSPHC